MHWIRLSQNMPMQYKQCVVKQCVNNRYKYCMGSFVKSGTMYVWQLENGENISCLQTDVWCYVDDIISYVGDRLISELQYAAEYLFK